LRFKTKSESRHLLQSGISPWNGKDCWSLNVLADHYFADDPIRIRIKILPANGWPWNWKVKLIETFSSMLRLTRQLGRSTGSVQTKH
jgi:hypothetical protein